MKLPYFLTFFCVLMSSPLVMAAAQGPDEGRPNEHFCPITLSVMVDPVVAADGQSYERAEITRWFTTSRKNPLGADLEHTNLIANVSLKNMIRDWIPGRSHEPSTLDSKSAADIARDITKEFEKNKRLLASARGKHIVAFLGNTGSGKSTLVNLLSGKGLVVGPYGDDYVLADPTDREAMVIGTRGKSQTQYPQFIDVNDLRFFDLPEFNDTDGSERNLVNAAFIRQILLEAVSVRLVFVAGQDQFTADRSASVKRMFNSIKQLFVVDGQGDTLVDEGVFVSTKVTCIEGANILEYLRQRTDAIDKEALNVQLQSWDRAKRLCHIFHPARGNNNGEAGEKILRLIQGARPARIVGVNVRALYPPETVRSLERMFSNMMEEALARKLGMSLTTVSDYDRAIAAWTCEGFWGNFDTELCAEEQVVGLLKEFCINPYRKALVSFERENVRKRQAHIQNLNEKRQNRIMDIEERTGTRTDAPVQQETTVARGIAIPEIARGHEEFYRRFMNGKLIYKPDPNSDIGRIEMPFAALANPLGGTFDLKDCGDTGQHLSISTGYRKAKNPANANKVEIWIVPRFLVEKELSTTAAHFGHLMGTWTAATSPLGLFWTWGGWDRLDYYDCLTTQTTEQIAAGNLLLNYNKSTSGGGSGAGWRVRDWHLVFQCFYVN